MFILRSHPALTCALGLVATVALFPFAPKNDGVPPVGAPPVKSTEGNFPTPAQPVIPKREFRLTDYKPVGDPNAPTGADPTPWGDTSVNAAPPRPNSKPVQADLGRPWRPYTAVAYLFCEIGDHIKPEGWDNWRNPENEKTARYREYHNTGPGANPAGRVPWSRQLTDEEAANYTLHNILGGPDHWDPNPSPSAAVRSHSGMG